MADTIVVRIKPLKDNKNRRTQSYTIRGQRFEEKIGWYEVPARLRDALKNATVDGNPEGERVFDVCETREEAADLERSLVKQNTARGSAMEPRQMGTGASDSPRAIGKLRDDSTLGADATDDPDLADPPAAPAAQGPSVPGAPRTRSGASGAAKGS